MANNVISQVVTEVVIQPDPKGRVSQAAIEVIVQPDPKGRITQAVVEVIVGPEAIFKPRVVVT